MARVFGVELVALLLLGFAVGILTFMYWSTRRELSALQGENEKLERLSSSEASTCRYMKSLVESDLGTLHRDITAKKEEISGLVSQLANLKEELVSAVFLGQQLQLLMGYQQKPTCGFQRSLLYYCNTQGRNYCLLSFQCRSLLACLAMLALALLHCKPHPPLCTVQQ